jgi:DNA repair protein RadC
VALLGPAGTIVDFKLVFATALKCAASGIILVHNHPSGQLNPSREDTQLTNRCKQAAEYLQIRLLDHLIITKHGFFSFRDEGLL